MSGLVESLPPPLEAHYFDEATLALVRKNAGAGSFLRYFVLFPLCDDLSSIAMSRNSTTPKRPRPEPDAAQTESAKRLRSSLRSSTKSIGVNSQPASDDEKDPYLTPMTTIAPKAPVTWVNVKPVAKEIADDDLRELLAYARDCKHKGDELRKDSSETVKKHPDLVRLL